MNETASTALSSWLKQTQRKVLHKKVVGNVNRVVGEPLMGCSYFGAYIQVRPAMGTILLILDIRIFWNGMRMLYACF